MNNFTRIIQTRSRAALKNDENIASTTQNPVHRVKQGKSQQSNKRVPIVARKANVGALVNITNMEVKTRIAERQKASRQPSKQQADPSDHSTCTLKGREGAVVPSERNQVKYDLRIRRNRSKSETQNSHVVVPLSQNDPSNRLESLPFSGVDILSPMRISTSDRLDEGDEAMVLDPMITNENVQIEEDQRLNEVSYDDIDQDDRDDPQAVAEYAEEIYKWLREKETRDCVKFDYVSRQTDLVEKFRTILVDWLIEVHFKFELRSETLFLTVALIDRYLNVVSVPRTQLQLVGVTALLIASKYEEIYPPECADLTFITKETYTKEELLSCEESMLNVLHFNLSVPTPFHFLKRFVKASKVETAKFYCLCKYLLEATLLDLSMSNYRPSQLAAAIVYLARASLGQYDPLWTSTLQHYTTYTEDAIRPVAHKVSDFVATLRNSDSYAVVKKYKSTKFYHVAFVPLATV